MNLAITDSMRLFLALVFGLTSYGVLAGATQQPVFNTYKGFTPLDYVQAYPSVATQCPPSAAMARKEFHSSGSVLETFADGHGAVYQAMFAPFLGSMGSTKGVAWAGDLRALMIDAQGNWRSDNGDKRLGSLQEDPFVSSCVDASTNLRRYRLSQSPLNKSSVNCNALHYPFEASDIGYLWQAGELLSKMSQQEASIQRHPFQRKANQRFIRTHIDQQEYDFVGTRDFPFQPHWFGLASEEKAVEVIEFIRGRELADWRSRYLDQQMFRLGDTLNAQPVHVAAPAANFHLLYGDASYQAFLEQYRERRARIFLNTHDGLLHAFNAGWYDPVKKQIMAAPEYSNGSTEWALGQEMWAFVPFDVFPLLAHYADKHYAQQGQEHLNLLSHAPYVFDARIFKHQGGAGLQGQADRVFVARQGRVVSHDTHPGGWGTLMVTGFGQGGGDFITQDSKGNSQLFQPGYLLFDITDAEQAPKLLAYIRHPSLGSSLTQPAVVTLKNRHNELQWHLVLGSGADLDPKGMQALRSSQSAKLLVYNLHKLEKEVKAGGAELIDLAIPAAYVAGMSAADWQLDGATDALYVSATGVQGTQANAQWRSALLRIWFDKTSGGWHRQKLLSMKAPLSFRPQLSVDALKNRWIYLATGRVSPAMPGSTSVNNSIVGIKETRDLVGNFEMDKLGQSSTALSLSKLLRVETVKVNSLNGDLQGTLQLSPALARHNVIDLEQRLMQYSDASSYVPGWYRALDSGEAASAEGSLYGGLLSQATRQRKISANACLTAEESFVHQLRFTTGTAWYDESQIPASVGQKTSRPVATLTDTRKQVSGTGSLTSYLLQAVAGSGKANFLTSDQNGGLQAQTTNFLDYVVSGEISWREL